MLSRRKIENKRDTESEKVEIIVPEKWPRKNIPEKFQVEERGNLGSRKCALMKDVVQCITGNDHSRNGET